MRFLAALVFCAASGQALQIAGGISGMQVQGGRGQVRVAQPSPPQDLGTMSGQVFDGATGEPLRKATVQMNLSALSGSMRPAQTSFSSTTDATGKFTITHIEPGTYRVTAQKTGYLSMQYNARRPDGPGTPVEIGRGGSVNSVNFRLVPHGVISGKIVDEDGDPLQYVQIQICKLTWIRGRMQYQQMNGTNTNDLGDYRLFGITPGKYYLYAAYRSPMRGDPSQQHEDYIPLFYPGVADISAATPLEMKPGQQLQGINIKLNKVRTVTVKGTVINNTSAAPPPVPVDGPGGRINQAAIPVRINSTVQLEPRTAMMNFGMASQGSGVRPDGSFVFDSVAPGPYNLIAFSGNGPNRHTAVLPIEVSDTGLDGVTITINPGAPVSGHVRVEGETTDSIPTFTVRMQPWQQGPFNLMPQGVKVEADGTFRFDEVPAEKFDIMLQPLPGNLYIKSIRAGNVDVFDNGLDLSNGGGASLDVVIGVNATQITGTVQDGTTQQPALSSTVVLVPSEPERRQNSSYYHTASTDQNGNYTIGRVAPGEYKIYAFDDIEPNSWFDPDFMRLVESRGMSVSVKENTPVTQPLISIPPPSGN